MALNAMIPMSAKMPQFMGAQDVAANQAAIEGNQQANALQGLRMKQAQQEMADYEANAPRRQQQQAIEDEDNKRQFLMDNLPFVNDNESLQRMRQKAVEIWGQTADDNMPTEYEPETFDMLRERLGIGPASKDVTYGTSLNVDEEGRPFVMGNDGSKKYVDGGLGLKPQQQIDYLQESGRAKKYGSEIGKEEASRAIAEPSQSAKGQMMLDRIDALMEHPGLSAVVGVPGPSSLFPGTEAANFKADLETIKGGQFMEAYQGLKGGGQITEIEGAKAEQAISNLSTARTEESFKNALREFRSIVATGMDRARRGVVVDGRGQEVAAGMQQPTRKIVRTGSMNGRKIVQYDDGSIDYAD